MSHTPPNWQLELRELCLLECTISDCRLKNYTPESWCWPKVFWCPRNYDFGTPSSPLVKRKVRNLEWIFSSLETPIEQRKHQLSLQKPSNFQHCICRNQITNQNSSRAEPVHAFVKRNLCNGMGCELPFFFCLLNMYTYFVCLQEHF